MPSLKDKSSEAGLLQGVKVLISWLGLCSSLASPGDEPVINFPKPIKVTVDRLPLCGIGLRKAAEEQSSGFPDSPQGML